MKSATTCTSPSWGSAKQENHPVRQGDTLLSLVWGRVISMRAQESSNSRYPIVLWKSAPKVSGCPSGGIIDRNASADLLPPSIPSSVPWALHGTEFSSSGGMNLSVGPGVSQKVDYHSRGTIEPEWMETWAGFSLFTCHEQSNVLPSLAETGIGMGPGGRNSSFSPTPSDFLSDPIASGQPRPMEPKGGFSSLNPRCSAHEE